jgi:hypothetical protein
VSPNRTTSMKRTVLFSFSLLSNCKASPEFLSLDRLFSAVIYDDWYYCIFLRSFKFYFRAMRSEDSIVVLSILGTSFITKLYS